MFGNWKLVIGVCLVIVSCFLVIAPAGAMGGPAPEEPEKEAAVVAGVMVIENFEAGSLKSPREWWTFDITRAQAVPNNDLTSGDAAVAGQKGNYSLVLQGESNNWYAGGLGTYIAQEGVDLTGYNSLVLDIYGNGLGSGTLKIELVDDDNHNWQAEQDAAHNYALLYDDKYVYDINVDWDGWKKVIVPLDDFVDDNDAVGDNIWNPGLADNSGGLLQLQFVCLGSTSDGAVNYYIDNISLSKSEE